MLAGSGLNGRGVLPAVARQQFSSLSRSSRSISSFRPQVSRTAIPSGPLKQSLTGTRSWRPATAVLGASAARFNSTSTSTSPVAPETPSTDFPTGTGDQSLSDLTAWDVNSIPEKIGYLKELGLDFGWGPSSIVEFFIEHFHIWGGLPWWGGIVATGMVLRLALFKPMLGAVDTSTKMSNIKYLLDPLRAKMSLYQGQQRMNEMAMVREEIAQLQKKHEIKAWKSFIPLLQVPFGFGCYRVVKNMASLPVPGLASESFGWIHDLTVADPYYVLPVISSAMMYLTFKKGGEQGTNQLTGTAVGNAVLFGLPLMSFGFMAFFPSALQLYFVATGMFGLGQSYLVHSPAFRSFFNITQVQAPPSDEHSVSAQSKALRMLTDEITAEKARLEKESSAQAKLQVSLLDRLLNNAKQSKDKMVQETKDKLDEIRGSTPAKNADGTLAEPPRLSEKDRKLADDYEKRRREEEEWKREERNHARRQAHQRAMEQSREKARSAFLKASSSSKGPSNQ
ncbi:inner membrane protein translocase [Aspergillus ellipticus CBS 707.79]|uniref:Inner membrane protein translocase n=1 Tax=Aspergillus ellipticus CBS 707.79 TaxID=1448320 RepID=A0A319E644_9EURO|nr:inner membrane protein translocase [Aspergillus ellipticus CBS 707.79]